MLFYCRCFCFFVWFMGRVFFRRVFCVSFLRVGYRGFVAFFRFRFLVLVCGFGFEFVDL